jgi:hypothetical protein
VQGITFKKIIVAIILKAKHLKKIFVQVKKVLPPPHHFSNNGPPIITLLIAFKFQPGNSVIFLIVFAIIIPIHVRHKQGTAVRQNTAIYQRTSPVAETGMYFLLYQTLRKTRNMH